MENHIKDIIVTKLGRRDGYICLGCGRGSHLCVIQALLVEDIFSLEQKKVIFCGNVECRVYQYLVEEIISGVRVPFR